MAVIKELGMWIIMYIWFSWKLKIRINFPFRLRFLLAVAVIVATAAAAAVDVGWLVHWLEWLLYIVELPRRTIFVRFGSLSPRRVNGWLRCFLIALKLFMFRSYYHVCTDSWLMADGSLAHARIHRVHIQSVFTHLMYCVYDNDVRR